MTNRSQSDARPLDPGQVVRGRYVIDKQIASGGMAAIHRAHERPSGRPVALKALYPYYSENPVVCTRFLDEGRIQRYLNHPNIIDVFEIIEEPPLAIVMEYIDGPSLEEYLSEHGPLSVPQLLSVMLPVLSAVGFAHQQGVIHRDIKPSNILLERAPFGFTPKVMDFGVAKVLRGQDLTADGTTVGTLHYMSPEQIVGSKNIDGRADIYSLGVTIYKLCTGEVPFNAATEFALMMAQVEATPTPPSKLQPGVPRRLEEIILRALAKRPDGRFQTVRELTTALLELRPRAHSDDTTDTLTAPLPADLLRHAMMADQVATDRTEELNIVKTMELVRRWKGAGGGPAEDEDEQDDPGKTFELPRLAPGTPIDATLQLDRARLQAKIRADHTSPASASRPMSGEDLMRVHAQELGTRDTRPMERETTRETNAPDSRALTRPFERPSAAPDAVSTGDRTQPLKVREDMDAATVEDVPTQFDPPPARPQVAPARAHQPPVAAASADASADPDGFNRLFADMPRIADLVSPAASGPQLASSQSNLLDPEARIELRARAASAHSRTDISRDRVQAGMESAAQDSARSRLPLAHLTIFVLALFILILVLVWAFTRA